MEHEERKIAKVYAVIALYTIVMLAVGILLGFAMGKKSIMSERETQWVGDIVHNIKIQ